MSGREKKIAFQRRRCHKRSEGGEGRREEKAVTVLSEGC
jgi:hypothetical protein